MHWLDPDYLPEISGTFERFLLNPHGDADGMMLGDGTEIHFPPHMSAELIAAIRPGEKPKIRIRGVRPRNRALIAAVAIETVDGKRIVDNGPPKKPTEGEKPGKPGSKAKHEPMHAEGRVRQVLHGPKGEARGALLEDGTIIRVPAHEAERIAPLLLPGRTLAARGDGLTSKLGTVIEAREAGPSVGELRPLKPKKPKHEERGNRPADSHAV
jgi:hypothetical protein